MRASEYPEIVYILIVDKTNEVIDMAIEGQLTMEARKARPEASVRFERNGQILRAVVDFCVIQMGILEKGIDDAAPR